MSILIDKNSRVLTQGITGKTGQFHTHHSVAYAFGKQAYVAGVTPGKGGQEFEGIPVYDTVAEAKQQTGANVSVIYVPPAFAEAAIEQVRAIVPKDKNLMFFMSCPLELNYVVGRS